MPVSANLKLASFDGGGGRSISQLEIMGVLMHRLRFDIYPNEPERMMLPCEHFDMIGGSDTGGLLALMFTKLRMSVEDVTEEFCAIVDAVYQNATLTLNGRNIRLKECIEDLLKRKELPIDLRLAEGWTEGQCAGFVLTSSRTNIGHTVRLRTYPVRSEPSLDVTVVDAILATCASQPEFMPVVIGARYKKQEYVGPVLGSNNPSRELISEAHLLFGGDASVACFLSLGSGRPGSISMRQNTEIPALASLMRDVLLDCERRSQEMQEQIGRLGIYFRLSVELGTQNLPTDQACDLSWIVTQTEVYLSDSEVSGKADACVKGFQAPIGFVTLDQLKYSGGPNIVYKLSPMLATHYIRREVPWNRLVGALDDEIADQRVIIITGMTGCGKTQLVSDLMREYNPQQTTRFDHIFFVDGSSETSIQLELVAHVQAVMPGSQQINLPAALNFFQNPNNKRWLIIYDNVDDIKIDIRPLLPKCSHGTIVVTTRNQLLRKLASKPSFHLELGVMSEKDAVELIFRCAGLQSSSEERRAAAPIAGKLGYLPVALTQAGAYMHDTGFSCLEYLDLLLDHLAELMEKPSGDRQNQSAYAAFDLIYSRLSPQSQLLIHLLSCFHSTNFPVAIIPHAAARFFGEEPFCFVSRGMAFEPAIRMLEQIFLPGGTWSKLTLPSLTSTLQNHSLASFTSTPLTQLIHIHPLIHEWASKRIPPEQHLIFQEAACRLTVCSTDAGNLHPHLISHISTILSSSGAGSVNMNDRAAFGRILRMSGQAEPAQAIWMSIYKQMHEDIGPQSLQVATAALELAETYDDSGLREMEMFEREGVQIRTSLLGVEHLDTLKATIQLSCTLARLRRHDESQKMGQAAVDGLKQQLPPNHPDAIEALDSLAYIHGVQNRYSEAEALQYQVLDGQITRFGEMHLNTIAAMEALGWTYYEQRRYSDAEHVQVKVLETRKAQLGDEHLDTIAAMQTLAVTYHSQGRYSDAEQLQVKVLETRKAQLGDQHADTIAATHSLAVTYHSQRRYSDAERLKVKVLETRKAQLGDEHLDTTAAIHSLALTYHSQGRYSDAEQLQVKVLETRKAQLGDEHSDTIAAMQKLAVIYHSQGHYSDAEVLKVKVLGTRKAQLGDEHSDTIAAMQTLAVTYHSQGRYSDAERLKVKVLETRKAQLGEGHPDTVAAMQGLALTFYSQGHYTNAKELEIKVLEMRKEQLGEEHPDTVAAMQDLALTFYSQGHYTNAEDLEVKVLEILTRLEGSDSCRVADAKKNLGWTYYRLGRLKEARYLALKAETVYRNTLGIEHPEYNEIVQLLGKLKKK